EVELEDDPEAKKTPPFLWADLTGNLELKFRNAITHIYIGSGNPSIQDKMISGTVYKRSVSGMSGGYIPSTTEEFDKDTLTPEEIEEIKILREKRRQRATAAAAAPVGKAVTMPPAQEVQGTKDE